ncbi:MAG: AAA family ATPase [Alphaproteobacteria bacterium]|nr:AAA family ATPase [Alphaproteobacteria bacterium]
MPYLTHFGLTEHPFTLTPNTSQFFSSKEHLEIFDALCCGIERNSGIFKVVGEVGTGKTMLCQLFLHKFINKDCIAYINAPQASVDHLLDDLCLEFGLKTSPYYSPLTALRDFMLENHAKNRRVILVIDEAQALNADGLETIRLLSNLETETKKLLQIVLFGQKELDKLLNKKNLRQLKQRIVFAFKTRPLSYKNSINYIKHRVECCKLPCSNNDTEMFNARALHLIAKSSRGTARVINILADKSMLTAYGNNEKQITASHVEYAIDETRGIADPVWLERNYAKTAAKIVAAFTFIIGFAILSQTQRFDNFIKGTRHNLALSVAGLSKIIAEPQQNLTATAATTAATNSSKTQEKHLPLSGMTLLSKADLSISNIAPPEEIGDDISPAIATAPKHDYQTAKAIPNSSFKQAVPKKRKFKYFKNAKQYLGTDIVPDIHKKKKIKRDNKKTILSDKKYFINKDLFEDKPDQKNKETSSKTKEDTLKKDITAKKEIAEIPPLTEASKNIVSAEPKKVETKATKTDKKKNMYEFLNKRQKHEH